MTIHLWIDGVCLHLMSLALSIVHRILFWWWTARKRLSSTSELLGFLTLLISAYSLSLSLSLSLTNNKNVRTKNVEWASSTWAWSAGSQQAVRTNISRRNNFGSQCQMLFMSIQVLTVLVSAHSSGLVYKEHSCNNRAIFIIEICCLLSLSLSLTILCVYLTIEFSTNRLCTLCLTLLLLHTYSFTISFHKAKFFPSNFWIFAFVPNCAVIFGW